MGKRAALIPVVLLVLVGLLAWRVRVQEQRKHAPTGGSTTIEGTETEVESKIPGRLVELTVDKGDRVKAGQRVGRIECKDPEAALAAAKARLEGCEAQREAAEAAQKQAQRSVGVARAQIVGARAQQHVLAVDRALAQRNLDRLQKLAAAGAATSVDLDSTSTRARNLGEQAHVADASIRTALATSAATAAGVQTAQAQIAVAQAQLLAARADVDRADLSVAECNLVAPRDGVVTERLREPGAVLPAGARVLTVVDLSTVKLSFFVPDAELGRVHMGAPAEVRVDAFPGRVWKGKVRSIASEAEFTPRDVQTREDRDRLVYAVEVEVQNPDGSLRAGMPGDVALPGTER
jgi:HlyD family secretion protein